MPAQAVMHRFDLEDRTRLFASSVRSFARRFPRSYLYIDDIRQVIRSSGSVAANYLEANNALSKKDFFNRIKICRKEARETVLWIELLKCDSNNPMEKERQVLLQEAKELVLIFAAILRTSGVIS
jgi:four helix bundle protein